MIKIISKNMQTIQYSKINPKVTIYYIKLLKIKIKYFLATNR